MKALATLPEVIWIWGSIGPGGKNLANLMNANDFPFKLAFLAQQTAPLIWY